MKPSNLKTRIFLDSGDPQETREALELLGFLDGQTTNPSLIANNPQTAGKKFSKNEILDFYKKVVQEISGLIPAGSVSVEVYADPSTTATEMIEQGKAFNEWIPNAHIKYPLFYSGLSSQFIFIFRACFLVLTIHRFLLDSPLESCYPYNRRCIQTKGKSLHVIYYRLDYYVIY